jgi:DnaJ-class molecular chaperone
MARSSLNVQRRLVDETWKAAEEMIEMVRKETCPACKGNRWVTLKDTQGRDLHRKCPVCGGQGYKIRLEH